MLKKQTVDFMLLKAFDTNHTYAKLLFSKKIANMHLEYWHKKWYDNIITRKKELNMKRCIIVGGAPIENYELIKKQIQTDDFIIYCDCGLRHEKGLKFPPSLIVGDFDSHKNPLSKTETIILPKEKDDTDTVFAVKEGIKRGFDDFVLIGVAGERLDHTIGNVSILLYLLSQNKKGKIIDNYSEMEIVSKSPVLIENKYSFFSLLNISGNAKGINIKNAKYPLENGEITCEYQYGISNETINDSPASVSVSDGCLLLIKVF